MADRETVRVLRDPATYACVAGVGTGAEVEVIETHMAWVFLVGPWAFKLKKSLHMDGADLRTLAARRRACTDEVRLNRRLAGRVYRDVVPLVRRPGGTLVLGGPRHEGPCPDTAPSDDTVVDWLVQMQRLPREAMLDARIEAGTVAIGHVRAAVRLLAAFYQSAVPVPLDPACYVTRLREQSQARTRAILTSGYDVPPPLVRHVHGALQKRLRSAAPVLRARAAAQRIVEAHGDLRPQHVCLTPDPVLIDGLEFERELRLLEPVRELTHLTLECAYLGAPWIGDVVFETYGDVTGDRPPPALLHLYAAHRAHHRAQIAVRHTRGPGYAQWRDQAMAYLRLACEHLEI
jgi:aminoglycoside phosphotransferase family enzyme